MTGTPPGWCHARPLFKCAAECSRIGVVEFRRDLCQRHLVVGEQLPGYLIANVTDFPTVARSLLNEPSIQRAHVHVELFGDIGDRAVSNGVFDMLFTSTGNLGGSVKRVGCVDHQAKAHR